MSDLDFYQQAQRAFLSLCELEVSERLQRLAEIQAADPRLHARVAAMLDADEDLLPDLTAAAETNKAEDTASENDDGNAGVPEIEGLVIQSELGRGGMGIVWRAVQQETNREVALKTVKTTAHDSPSFVARFRREVEFAARLSHPGIARVFESGLSNKTPYYVMELVDGVDLGTYVKDAKPTEAERIELVIHLCHAVGHAHQHGVIHRDLKPSNILVDSQGRPHIVDFGIARSLTSDDLTQMTGDGQLLGTPGYMSPEQVHGDPNAIDTRSDIYSLGVILFELTVGQHPRDVSGPQIALLRSIAEDDVPHPRQLSSDISRDLESVILKALEQEPDRRYGAASEFAEDLNRILAGHPVSARRIGTIGRVTRACRRRPLVAFLSFGLLVAVVALAIGGPLIAWRQSRLLAQVQNEQTEKRRQRIATLLSSDISSLPERLTEMSSDIGEVIEDLDQAVVASEVTEAESLRIDLTRVAAGDTSRLTSVMERALASPPDELLAIRHVLAPYSQELVSRLWKTALDQNLRRNERFRAACLIAEFDTDSERWDEISVMVSDILLSEDPFLANEWARILKPSGRWLLPSLGIAFRQHDKRTAIELLLAAQFTALYAAEKPEQLAELLADAREQQFDVVFEALLQHRTHAIRLMEAELTKYLAAPAQPDALPNQTDDPRPQRMANFAVALLRLGRSDTIWPLLKHTSDPTLRSWVVTHLALYGADPEELTTRLLSETEVSVCRALMQALGHYSTRDLRSSSRDALLSKVRQYHQDPADAGLHAAADWLLRTWGYRSPTDPIPEARSYHDVLVQDQDKDADDRSPGWFVTCDQQVMVAFTRPVTFLRGSPESEIGRYETREQLRETHIPYGFAVAATELTRREFENFQSATGFESTNREFLTTGPQEPKALISWIDMAQYCNWLSDQEGIPRSQWAYEPDSQGVYSTQSTYHLDRTGYRVITDTEWEYASRAGASTVWTYGNSAELFPWYGWGHMNSGLDQRDVALMIPNDFGLFDVHGNLREICLNYHYPTGPAVNFRGGWAGSVLWQTRCAYRGLTSRTERNGAHGFRIACTLFPERASSKSGEGLARQTADRDSSHQAQVEKNLEFTASMHIGPARFVRVPQVPLDGLQEFTIETWIRDWNGIILSLGRLRPDEGKIAFGTKGLIWAGPQAPRAQDTLPTVDTTGWHHWAFTYVENVLTVFHDGNVLARLDVASPPAIGDFNSMLIGRLRGSSTVGTGEIHTLRISSQCLYEGPFTPRRSIESDHKTLLLLQATNSGSGFIPDRSSFERHGKQVTGNPDLSAEE